MINTHGGNGAGGNRVESSGGPPEVLRGPLPGTVTRRGRDVGWSPPGQRGVGAYGKTLQGVRAVC